MAKQTGIIPLSGTIDNLSFYHDKRNGNLARKAGGPTKHQIDTLPVFERTRENNKSFSQAAKGGKLLRNAFRQCALNAGDGYTNLDVHRILAAILHTDTLNPRGAKELAASDLTLLEDFNWNRTWHLESTIPTPFTEVSATSVIIHIPALNPASEISAPIGATHYELRAACAALDFTAKQKETLATNSDKKLLNTAIQPAESLTLPLAFTLNAPVFVGLCITFYQKSGQLFFPLKQGNAFSIIKVIM